MKQKGELVDSVPLVLSNTMVNINKYCCYDFETTGFKENAPVSLAISCYENNKRVFAKYYLINPQAEIESGAYKVHGIS